MASQAQPHEPPGDRATIVHDRATHKFATSDGQAYAEYALLPPPPSAETPATTSAPTGVESGVTSGGKSGVERGVMDIRHTYVPPSRRGEGLAARLCEAAFDYAKENGLYVRPTCSYVEETFLKRHPACRDWLEPGALRPTFSFEAGSLHSEAPQLRTF